jgi:hypothetical protein
MTNKNYVAGRNFESRFLADLKKRNKSIKGGRFYGSKGITDVWWVSPKGVHHEAQLKYSRKKPYIHPQEMQELQKFSKEMNGKILVWLVKKQARKTIEMELVT